MECKGDAAQKAALFLTAHRHGSAAIAGAVGHWYRARGVAPCYRSELDLALEPIGSAPTDAQRQLKWLSKQVAPVVKRLAWVYGMDAVLAVLASAKDPSTVLPIPSQEEESLADYDAWTIASEGQSIED